MRFRPCIDLHNGHVKQIVGATLSDEGLPTTNFETDKPAADFARLYRSDGLSGGHIAMLGEGNESAAGLSDGIDKNLVELLGRESPLPTTYAGGISSYTDIEAIEALGKGRIDYTVGSALDIFGGTNLIYADLAKRTAG